MGAKMHAENPLIIIITTYDFELPAQARVSTFKSTPFPDGAYF